ncbi:MAG: hypothetical protein AB1505_35295 [Candidatus Latescibacterota bacterium]
MIWLAGIRTGQPPVHEGLDFHLAAGEAPRGGGMARRVLPYLALGLAAAAPARAHRLTGTDVATVAALLVDHHAVSGVYEVQYGELAALEERRRMDADGDGRLSPVEQEAYLAALRQGLEPNLELLVDGEPLPVRLEGSEVAPDERLVAPGQMTVRFTLSSAPVDFARRRLLRFRDANTLPRLVHADVWVEAAPLVDIDEIHGLEGALKQVRVQSVEPPVLAEVAVQPSETVWRSAPFAAGGTVPESGSAGGPAPSGGTDRLQDVLRSGELSAGLVALALALAVFLGAAHALEPGHGKTIVAAYLVGARGTVANAVFLGGVVTFTHTFSVVLLGLVTLFASHYVLPEEIFPWLGATSGLLIAGVGIWLYTRALRVGGHGHDHGPLGRQDHAPASPTHDHAGQSGHGRRYPGPAAARPTAQAHVHPHPHPHAHPHDPAPVHGHPGHTHAYPARVTPGGLLALGISGGIVPCPGALVILLLAVALHRIAFGLTLIVSFSLGLAAVLIGIGVLMVRARPLVDRLGGEGRLVRSLPIASAVAVTAVGLAMAVRSLMEAGIVVIRMWSGFH